jgi:hypothetical protein
MGVPPAKLHEKPAKANKWGTRSEHAAGFFDPVARLCARCRGGELSFSAASKTQDATTRKFCVFTPILARRSGPKTLMTDDVRLARSLQLPLGYAVDNPPQSVEHTLGRRQDEQSLAG